MTIAGPLPLLNGQEALLAQGKFWRTRLPTIWESGTTLRYIKAEVGPVDQKGKRMEVTS